MPGFIDAHCHILAYAASLLSVDCSPDAVSCIDDILRAIRRQAERTPPGEWIRAAGYSDFDLREKRHPMRHELDRAAPDNPVRLNHRSGHACVLNSLALERVGIAADTEEPPGGTIARDLDTAAPNGVLLDMDAWLDERIPRISDAALRNGLSRASREFLAQGVTTAQDATHFNNLDRWDTLRRMKADGVFVPSLSVMPAATRLHEFAGAGTGTGTGAGLKFGDGDDLSTLGHAKIMLTYASGRLHPSADDLRELVAAAHAHGFPVAIHAVESEEVIAAADVLQANKASELRDRIEHASECPPAALDALLRARPVVVSQPRFLQDSGARYISEFGAEAKSLYRFKTLSEAGITLAASSDAPVSAPSPLGGIQAAVTRRASSGEIVGADERLTAMQSLGMQTTAAAYAMHKEDEIGSIAPGKRADFAVLSDDPTTVAPEYLSGVRVTMTILGGRVVWQA